VRLDNGAELSAREVETVEKTDANHGHIWVINHSPTNNDLVTLEEAKVDPRTGEKDLVDYPRRKVAVVRRAVVEVSYRGERSAFNPVALRHGVELPTVLPVGGDPRRPRETASMRIVENVSPAKSEAA
jgi:hypothetical protein